MQPPGDTPPKRTRPTGAGRKVGSLNRATRLRLAGYEDSIGPGVLPLEVMVRRMRSLWEKGDEAAAFFAAVQCAPYLHAKLSAVVVDTTVRLDPSELSDAQLAAIVGNSLGGQRKSVEKPVVAPVIEHEGASRP